MKSKEFVSLIKENEMEDLSPCHYDLDESSSARITARDATEVWLNRKMEDGCFNFQYFITLSFFKATKSPINQYLDNHHIKKVILDFFYPNGKKSKDRIRLWFFVERHKVSRKLHLHILSEGIDGLSWLCGQNRKIEISKDTLFDVIADEEYTLDDVIIEALNNHLKRHIKKLGNGKQATNFKKIGDFSSRIHYVNKSLLKYDFDGWEHIDIQNSDL